MSTMITDAALLSQVEAFCSKHGLAPSTFGRLAVGDGSFVANLRDGRSPTLKMANRVGDFMASYRVAA